MPLMVGWIERLIDNCRSLCCLNRLAGIRNINSHISTFSGIKSGRLPLRLTARDRNVHCAQCTGGPASDRTSSKNYVKFLDILFFLFNLKGHFSIY